MKNHISVFVVVSVLFASVVTVSTASAMSADWTPVDQDVWTILMEEPQAHLLRAQEDLANKDTKGAAAEILRADTFLKIQEKRLAVASNQLTDLAKDIQSGKVVSAKEVEDTSNRAVSVLDHRQNLLPVITGADTMFMDEADYHMAQAKSQLTKNDNKAAAGDIRKAAAYLKLKAVHAGEKTKSEILSSATELEDLAGKVEAGTVATGKDLEHAFERARKAVGGAV